MWDNQCSDSHGYKYTSELESLAWYTNNNKFTTNFKYLIEMIENLEEPHPSLCQFVNKLKIFNYLILLQPAFVRHTKVVSNRPDNVVIKTTVILDIRLYYAWQKCGHKFVVTIPGIRT